MKDDVGPTGGEAYLFLARLEWGCFRWGLLVGHSASLVCKKSGAELKEVGVWKDRTVRYASTSTLPTPEVSINIYVMISDGLGIRQTSPQSTRRELRQGWRLVSGTGKLKLQAPSRQISALFPRPPIYEQPFQPPSFVHQSPSLAFHPQSWIFLSLQLRFCSSCNSYTLIFNPIRLQQRGPEKPSQTFTMADPQVQIGSGSNPVNEDDVEMQGGDDGGEVVEVAETGAAAGEVPDQEEKPTERVTFIE